MKNGELTALRKVLILFILVGMVVGPWLFHDRAITKIQTDLTYIKVKLCEIDDKLGTKIAKCNKGLIASDND